MPIKLEIVRKDLLRYESKLRTLAREVSYEKDRIGGVMNMAADALTNDLRDNINRQTFAAEYDPLTKKYKRYKELKGYSPKFWVRSSEMLRNIVSWKSGTYWTSGISDRKLASIAKWNEQGTKDIPARPLFGPTSKNFIQSRTLQKLWANKISEISKSLSGR